MHNRWENFRENVLSNSNILNVVDSFRNEMQQAQLRNFEKWNILGRYVWPNPYPYAYTFDEEVDNLQDWIEDRLNWIDNNLPDPQLVNINETENLKVVVSPNPVYNDVLSIYFSDKVSENTNISILDLSGKILYSANFENITDKILIQVNNFSGGIYFVKITNSNENITQKVIIQ
jgi:hypothetical protein